MTEEPKPDYEKMYNELKTQYDSINTKISNLEATITDRDKKINELQIYIADNVVSKRTEKSDIPNSFDDIYNKTLSEMKNKKG